MSQTLSSISKYIPLYTAAVEPNTCKIDAPLLLMRTYAVAIATFAAFSAAFVVMTAIPALAITATAAAHFFKVALISSLVLSLLSHFSDWHKAERVADENAVNEYLHMQFPSHEAAERIQWRPQAAKLLIEKKGDVNKLDVEGKSLIHCLYNFDAFKIIIDNGFDIKNVENFKNLVFEKNPIFLEYVLSKKLVSASDFTPEQQCQLWCFWCPNSKSAEQLKKYGFDIDAKDKDGYTALLITIASLPNDAAAPQVARLLSCGADPHIWVKVDGKLKNAFELNTDPQIEQLLKQQETPI